MSELESRALHLHTLASLVADLVSGRPISTGKGKNFILPDDRTRSALEWYRKKGPANWTANVNVANAEDLVDAILLEPPQLSALPARPANANGKRLRLKKVEAHRFAGLHKFGTPSGAPENYVHDFYSPLTLFEGRNGSGKTSLLNAVIWALTGEMLRPQRAPETAVDFECWVDPAAADAERTTHKLSPLTPMPNVEQYRPDQPWVPADTWVELTFVDEAGAELPVIRRSQVRSPQGKLNDNPPDLSILGIDPIAVRIGTIMPGLLSLIKVGSESELGRAVSQLTGLSALIDLAEHVRRAKLKIDKEFMRAKKGDLDRIDRNYSTAKGDLENILLAQPTIRTTPPLPVIEQRKSRFEANPNLEEPAREFADGCRVFFEAKLGDMFDDPAHAAWAIANPDPTLATFVQRLRPLVRTSPQGMFSAHIFRRFVDHRALVDGSPVIVLMNKAHHGRRSEIRPADVAQCADDLSELLEIVEAMYEECYRWRRRDASSVQSGTETPPQAITPTVYPALSISVCPDLAAFTRSAPSGESQASPEQLEPTLLANTATYLLRRPNFGFAAPVNSIALVEAMPGPAADRRLVIARYADATYARRLVRGADTDIIGLTAEVLAPRARTPKTIFLPEASVAIHQVVGIIFDHNLPGSQGRDEAVRIDAGHVLGRVTVAFRVIDDSAVPLALEGQVVLGGEMIQLNELSQRRDALVALTLGDGSSIFKRVGATFPGDLDHLRQFESIGGLGSSQVLSVGKPHKGFQTVTSVRTIVGVLYHG